MKLRTFPELPRLSERHGNPQRLPINHVFRKVAIQKTWLSYSYLPLNADTAARFLISAEAVTGDNAIAVLTAGQSRKRRPIARPSSGTGRRKKAAKPIAGRNSGDDLKKTGSGKKIWMMKVQHQAAVMVAFQ